MDSTPTYLAVPDLARQSGIDARVIRKAIADKRLKAITKNLKKKTDGGKPRYLVCVESFNRLLSEVDTRGDAADIEHRRPRRSTRRPVPQHV